MSPKTPCTYHNKLLMPSPYLYAPEFFVALTLYQERPNNSWGSLKDISGFPQFGEMGRTREHTTSHLWQFSYLSWIQKLPTAELTHCRLCLGTIKSFPPRQKSSKACLSHWTSAMALGQAFHLGAGDQPLFTVDLLFFMLKAPVSWCCPFILSRLLFLMSCIASLTSPSGCLLIFYF